MSNITDTIMNIQVFAFIGILIWLYFKPDVAGSDDQTEAFRKKGKPGAE